MKGVRKRSETPPPPAGGKLKVKIPIIPGLVSYETELSPDAPLGRLWAKSPTLVRVLAVSGLVLVVGLVGLGGWKFFKPAPPPSRPDLYAVRVVVLGPDGQPVEGSAIRSSVGNEPQQVPGGWEVEIPQPKVPDDRKVTFWATHPASGGQGSETLELGTDPTPRVEIHLSIPEATVRGTVLDPAGRLLADVRVSVSGYGDEGVVTTADGTFSLIAHLPPGERVRLHAEHPDHPPEDTYCWAGGSDCEIHLKFLHEQ